MEEQRRLEYQKYLETKVNPIMEEITAYLLAERPDNPGQVILELLEYKQGLKLSAAEQNELKRLKTQVSRLQEGEQDTDTESESEEDDYVDEMPVSTRQSVQRKSISAEAFGLWNKPENFQPRVIPKSEEQRRRILERLSWSFLFSALDEREKDIIVDAMEERSFQAEEFVIREGEDGNELFVLDSGELQCSKKFGDEQRILKTYKPGEAFGELALLYNAPRAASIKANCASTCWVLDRSCFNHIVKDAAMRKRQQFDDFLVSVELLENMDPYERSQIADVLQIVEFDQGDYVITQGEWGDVFYIIVEGEAIATHSLSQFSEAQKVFEYGPGQYFGELALLRGEPRAANIIAKTKLKCATLDQKAFKRMLGPLEDILSRNASKYVDLIKGN